MHKFSVGDKVKIDIAWLIKEWDILYPDISTRAFPFKDQIFTVSKVQFTVSKHHNQAIELKEKDIEYQLKVALAHDFMTVIHWIGAWFMPENYSSCFILDIME